MSDGIVVECPTCRRPTKNVEEGKEEETREMLREKCPDNPENRDAARELEDYDVE